MDYSGINAKVRTMRKFLFKREQYEILGQNTSVIDFGLKLKEYPMYKKSISSIEDSKLKRFSIEQKIILSLFDEYKRIHTSIYNYEIKKFLDAYYLKNEIRLINSFLCSIHSQKGINYSSLELHDILGKKFRFDADKLKQSKNIDQFVESLKGTIFYDGLSSVSEDNKTPFEMEMKLELYYFINVWNMKNRLDRVNKQITTKILGTEIDLRNIIWIYRLKKYYEFDESRIYAHLIPINYRIETHELKKMVESKNLHDLTSCIISCKYKDIFIDVIHDINGARIEYAFFHKMSKIFRTLETQYTNSIALTVGYIYRKEVELQNLTTLLECIKYKLEPKESLKHLNLIRSGY